MRQKTWAITARVRHRGVRGCGNVFFAASARFGQAAEAVRLPRAMPGNPALRASGPYRRFYCIARFQRLDFSRCILYNVYGPICAGWAQRYFHDA